MIVASFNRPTTSSKRRSSPPDPELEAFRAQLPEPLRENGLKAFLQLRDTHSTSVGAILALTLQDFHDDFTYVVVAGRKIRLCDEAQDAVARLLQDAHVLARATGAPIPKRIFHWGDSEQLTALKPTLSSISSRSPGPLEMERRRKLLAASRGTRQQESSTSEGKNSPLPVVEQASIPEELKPWMKTLRDSLRKREKLTVKQLNGLPFDAAREGVPFLCIESGRIPLSRSSFDALTNYLAAVHRCGFLLALRGSEAPLFFREDFEPIGEGVPIELSKLERERGDKAFTAHVSGPNISSIALPLPRLEEQPPPLIPRHRAQKIERPVEVSPLEKGADRKASPTTTSSEAAPETAPPSQTVLSGEMRDAVPEAPTVSLSTQVDQLSISPATGFSAAPQPNASSLMQADDGTLVTTVKVAPLEASSTMSSDRSVPLPTQKPSNSRSKASPNPKRLSPSKGKLIAAPETIPTSMSMHPSAPLTEPSSLQSPNAAAIQERTIERCSSVKDQLIRLEVALAKGAEAHTSSKDAANLLDVANKLTKFIEAVRTFLNAETLEPSPTGTSNPELGRVRSAISMPNSSSEPLDGDTLSRACKALIMVRSLASTNLQSPGEKVRISRDGLLMQLDMMVLSWLGQRGTNAPARIQSNRFGVGALRCLLDEVAAFVEAIYAPIGTDDCPRRA